MCWEEIYRSDCADPGPCSGEEKRQVYSTSLLRDTQEGKWGPHLCHLITWRCKSGRIPSFSSLMFSILKDGGRSPLQPEHPHKFLLTKRKPVVVNREKTLQQHISAKGLKLAEKKWRDAGEKDSYRVSQRQGRRQTLWQRVGDSLQTKASSGWDQAATNDALCGSPSLLPPARRLHSPWLCNCSSGAICMMATERTQLPQRQMGDKNIQKQERQLTDIRGTYGYDQGLIDTSGRTWLP